MTYARAWRTAVTMSGLAVLVLALAVAPVDTLVLVLLGAAVGTACSASVDATTHRATSWATVRLSAAYGACALPAAVALARWSWPAAGVVFAMLVVSAPPVVSRLAAWRSQHLARSQCPPRATRGTGTVGDSVAALLDRGPTPRRLAIVDTDTVCAAWRRSHLMLAAAKSSDETLLVARIRGLYLDELIKRYPVQMAAWFETEPRAVDGPERYLPDERDDAI